ncbi:MAG TPA: 3-dehydroquinate synthase [Patescibacteria group bacterium]|nr:3-dehydroquinate synthase [Patescibacteria group bacterium]
MAEVHVELGEQKYTIHIEAGGIERAGILLNSPRYAGRFTRKTLIVADEHTGDLFGRPLLNSLTEAGFRAELICVPAGEGSKSLAVAEQLYTRAIESGLDRKSPIIALGGGVVGDLTGFVAGTYLRGVPFVQIPTSLLAQVDSSVGGKTAVNHSLGKNLIGVFYQPQLVIMDPLTLTTLPERELLTGLAELIKHGVIADRELFRDLHLQNGKILKGDQQQLTDAVTRSCRIKAAVVAQDEREAGLRMILNFGHTIAHAIEGVTGYAKYTHGEAVAIGMHGAALLSRDLGHCGQETVDLVREMLQRYRLPVRAPGLNVAELDAFLYRDKKNIGGKIHWVLLEEIGKVQVSDQVPAERVRQVLTELT